MPPLQDESEEPCAGARPSTLRAKTPTVSSRFQRSAFPGKKCGQGLRPLQDEIEDLPGTSGGPARSASSSQQPGAHRDKQLRVFGQRPLQDELEDLSGTFGGPARSASSSQQPGAHRDKQLRVSGQRPLQDELEDLTGTPGGHARSARSSQQPGAHRDKQLRVSGQRPLQDEDEEALDMDSDREPEESESTEEHEDDEQEVLNLDWSVLHQMQAAQLGAKAEEISQKLQERKKRSYDNTARAAKAKAATPARKQSTHGMSEARIAKWLNKPRCECDLESSGCAAENTVSLRTPAISLCIKFQSR